jgi:hypothetical protein
LRWNLTTYLLMRFSLDHPLSPVEQVQMAQVALYCEPARASHDFLNLVATRPGVAPVQHCSQLPFVAKMRVQRQSRLPWILEAAATNNPVPNRIRVTAMVTTEVNPSSSKQHSSLICHPATRIPLDGGKGYGLGRIPVSL